MLVAFAFIRFLGKEARQIKEINDIDHKIFAQENGYSYLRQDKGLNRLLAKRELIPHYPVSPRHIFSSKLLGKEFKVFDACYLAPGTDEKAIRHFAILIKIEPYSLPRFALQNDSKFQRANFFAFVDGIPKADSFTEVINRQNNTIGVYAYDKNMEQIKSFLADKSAIFNVLREEHIQLLMFNKQYCCAYIPGTLKTDIDYFQALEQTAEKLIEALFLDSLKLMKTPLK